MKIDKNGLIKFATPLLIGLAIRIFYANVMPLTNDEGSYLYDGYLLSKGLWPFAYSFSRAPSLMLVVALTTKIFGNGILMGRMISITFGLASSLILYWIAKELINERVGYFSFLSYLLIPAVSSHNMSIHTQTLEMFFILSATALFIKGLSKIKPAGLSKEAIGLMAGSGLFWGLSALSRETSAIFPAIFIIYYLIINWKRKRSLFGYLSYPAVLGISALFIWGITWLVIASQVGLDKVTGVFRALMTMHSTGEVWTLGFTLKKKAEVVGAWLNENFIFYIFGIIFIYYLLHFVSKIKRSISLFLITAIYAFLSIILLPGFFNFRHSELNTFYKVFIPVFVLLLILYIARILKEQKTKVQSLILYLLIGISPLIFYGFYYRRLQPGYFSEFMPGLSLISGFVLASINFGRKQIFKTVFLGVLVLSLIYSFRSIYSLPHSGTFYLDAVENVTDWLNKNSSKDDEIFTSAVIFPYLSDRKLAMNISRPVIFGYPHLSSDIKYTLFPRDFEIIGYLKENKVKFVIVEKSMRDSFFNYHDDIKDYVFGSYHTAEIFKNKGNPIEIHELN